MVLRVPPGRGVDAQCVIDGALRRFGAGGLAHVVHNKVEAAYRRTDLFERRGRPMDDWAAYLASGES